MADITVKTRTNITREHLIPEADVVALLKLDIPNGSTLTQARLIGAPEGNMLLIVTQEPEQVADKIVTL